MLEDNSDVTQEEPPAASGTSELEGQLRVNVGERRTSMPVGAHTGITWGTRNTHCVRGFSLPSCICENAAVLIAGHR
jgi:hypothetical protein